jgi:hypothetical protein
MQRPPGDAAIYRQQQLERRMIRVRSNDFNRFGGGRKRYG